MCGAQRKTLRAFFDALMLHRDAGADARQQDHQVKRRLVYMKQDASALVLDKADGDATVGGALSQVIISGGRQSIPEGTDATPQRHRVRLGATAPLSEASGQGQEQAADGTSALALEAETWKQNALQLRYQLDTAVQGMQEELQARQDVIKALHDECALLQANLAKVGSSETRTDIKTKFVHHFISRSQRLKAFKSWKYNADKQRRAGCLTARIISHWTHRTAAAAFDSWHVHAQEQRRVTMSAAKVRPRRGRAGRSRCWTGVVMDTSDVTAE